MSGVSVLLPVYNGAGYLRPAIDSVLAQTHRDFELLVLDNASSDGSPEIAEAYRDARVRVLRNGTNLGLAGSLNRGLAQARFPLVARQDADDVSQPDRLARQVDFLWRHPDVALVGAQGWEIDEGGRRVGVIDKPCDSPAIAWTMLFDNAFVHTSVLFRREVVVTLGGYDQAYVYPEDFDLWSRLLVTHRAANLPDRLVSCRQHAASMTQTVQAGHLQQGLDVMARNQSAWLGAALRPDDAALLAQVRAGVPPPQKQYVLDRLDELRAQFLARHPEAAGSRDFRRTVGRQRASVLVAHRFRPVGLVVRESLRIKGAYPVLPTVVRRFVWAGWRAWSHQLKTIGRSR
jgi:hypothetical protein